MSLYCHPSKYAMYINTDRAYPNNIYETQGFPGKRKQTIYLAFQEDCKISVYNIFINFGQWAQM